MTDETLEQKIARLQQVPKGDSNYDEAQFQLGYIYTYEINYKNIVKAIDHYNRVNRDDLKKFYANAQFNLSWIYNNEINHKDIDQAIDHYNKVNRDDSAEAYAKAQLNLGHIYISEASHKNINQAIAHYNKVNRDDSTEAYANAQLYLGYIYTYEISHKDIDQAIEHYNKVNRDDSKKDYSVSQLILGSFFTFEKNYKNIDKAIEHYDNIIYGDSKEAYAKAQLALGSIFIYEKNPKDITIAEHYFNNVLYIKSDINLYFVAQILLRFLSKNTAEKQNDIPKDIELILNFINQIHQACQTIRDLLFVNFNDLENQCEQTIAHYTNPAVVFELLKKESLFRLNLVDFMNDPSENKVLLNWLDITPEQTNQEIKSFVASFSFNHHSLNQFRLYGLEDKQAGSGISMTLDASFFGSKDDDSIDYDVFNPSELILNNSAATNLSQDTPETKTIFPLPLYRCIYFDPETNYLALAKRSKQSFYLEHKQEQPQIIEDKWQQYLAFIDEPSKIEALRVQLDSIKNAKSELSKLITEKGWSKQLTDINQLITLATMPIASLVKHAAFEDENECRIFYITDIGDDKVKTGQSFNDSQQIYLDYGLIASHIDKIYLGPKCQPQHELWLKNHNKIEKLNIRRIIKSTMPLQ